MARRSRQTGNRRSKYLFVVATEGYRTEPIYFEAFQPEPGEGNIRFEILNHRHKNNPMWKRFAPGSTMPSAGRKLWTRRLPLHGLAIRAPECIA